MRSVYSLLVLCALPVVATAQSEARESEAVVLPEIQVDASADASAEGLAPAYAGGQVATGGRVGVLGTQEVMETPFSLNSYTQLLIQDQQAASVGDVLRNDPAVRVARGFGNFQQVYLLRGRPVFSDDIAYNGLYGLLPRQYLGAEIIERVEVFRGANAFLNGAAPGGSGLGGAVNIVPKRAPNEPLTQVTAGAESGGQGYLATDLARRFADDRFGLRLNAARRDGDTAVDGESRELSLISLGGDYREGGLRLSADVGYQDHRMEASQPNITFGSGVDILRAPDADESIAQSWTYSDAEDVFATLRAEYDFSDALTAWAALGGREGEEAARFANPTVVNAQGDTIAYRFDNTREDSVLTGELGLRAHFATGAVDHTVTASASAYRLNSRNAYAMSAFGGISDNIYRHRDSAMPPANFFTGGELDDPHRTQRVRTSSFALADELSLLDERLRVTLGARHQTLENYSYDYNSGARTAAYDESAITPVAGVLYRLTPELSVYANYIEGLVKGDTAPATSNGQAVANAGEALEPYETAQTELGLKFDTGRLGGTLSVYQSEQQEAGRGDDGVYRVIDERRYRGLEFTAYGELVSGLSLLGGFSLLDTKRDGDDAIGAPRLQATLGLDWAVPMLEGLSLDGRVIYTGKQYADTANTQELPSWTRLDLGARYLIPVGRAQMLTLRGRIENVTGEDYWASAGGYPGAGYLTVGAPRTVILSASIDF